MSLSHCVQHRELKKEQTSKLASLCKEQYQAQLDLQLKYHPLLYDTLDTLVMNAYTSQLHKLDDLHDKEVLELKKKLDAQNREEMKALAKKHKEKNELARWVVYLWLSNITCFEEKTNLMLFSSTL